MKKIAVIIAAIFISISGVLASLGPAVTKDIIETNGNLNAGSEIKYTTWILSSGVLNYLGDPECRSFTYDENALTFVSMDSIYGYKFNNDTKCIYKDSENPFVFPFSVREEKDIRPLWTMTFKLKEDLNNKSFTINGGNYSATNLSLLNWGDGTHDDSDPYAAYDYNLTDERYKKYKKEYNDYLGIEDNSDIDNNVVDQSDSKAEVTIENDTINTQSETTNTVGPTQSETTNLNNNSKQNNILIIECILAGIILICLVVIIVEKKKKKNE